MLLWDLGRTFQWYLLCQQPSGHWYTKGPSKSSCEVGGCWEAQLLSAPGRLETILLWLLLIGSLAHQSRLGIISNSMKTLIELFLGLSTKAISQVRIEGRLLDLEYFFKAIKMLCRQQFISFFLTRIYAHCCIQHTDLNYMYLAGRSPTCGCVVFHPQGHRHLPKHYPLYILFWPVWLQRVQFYVKHRACEHWISPLSPVTDWLSMVLKNVTIMSVCGIDSTVNLFLGQLPVEPTVCWGTAMHHALHGKGCYWYRLSVPCDF